MANKEVSLEERIEDLSFLVKDTEFMQELDIYLRHKICDELLSLQERYKETYGYFYKPKGIYSFKRKDI